MTKGSNTALSALSENTGSVIVSLGWSSPGGDGDADVSVLLLGQDGKVRSDADFYFYNNPVAPDGSVHLLDKTPTEDGNEDRISFDLTVVAPEVDRVVVAASRYGGAHFGEQDDLRVTLSDAVGESLLRFTIGDPGQVSAIIFGELYRREGDWKFRAVGQGYDSGLAGLATDFGVDIDDDADSADEDGDGDGDGTTLAATPETAGTAEPAGLSPDPAPEPEPAAALDAVPAPRRSVDETRPRKPAARPRTAKKRAAPPSAPQKSLAENDSWRPARLFPLSALKSDRDREMRATSVLLSVMTQVPRFGRRLTAAFGAPSGRMETFTEVSLPHGDTPRRPDGVIRIERAGKLWTALVETKTNGNALKADQVQAYMDIAARRGYEAVITVSNDVALEGSPLVDVRIDRRRKHQVALWHLSWAEVAHQAQLLIRHEGVGNAARTWLLQELLHYLQHENSGCHGFQNMGSAWVPVRNGINDETLCQGDPRALEVVESWERLIRQVCLRLGGELGQKVLPAQRVRRGTDHGTRRMQLADRLCLEGRLHAELRVEQAPGLLTIGADLRTGRLRTSVEVPAPEQGYPLTWAKRLMRRLGEAPADLHVETLVEGDAVGPRGTLERLRPEPADLLPKNGTQITGFRLSLLKGMGSTRGNTESGFIRSVDDAVHRFCTTVVVHLDQPLPRRAAQKEPV
ncbi:TerD family protein [Streptomyces sp. NPDC087859]|uniref:TerD family protein n=1 Tax=Streptomyces sp. NPDC087859 TaxID=3365812 RepID=UPI0037F9BB69